MAQWNLVVILTFLIIAFRSFHCLPSFIFGEAQRGNGEDIIQTVYLTKESHSSHVVKRSSNEMPDRLHFNFVHQNRPIRLRLKRSYHDDTQIPVFTLRRGFPVRRRLEDNPNISFYHDVDHGASFQLTSQSHLPHNPFHLVGTMFINGEEYLLSPEQRWLSVNGSETAHTLKKLAETLPFGRDVIDERGPYAQFLSTQREQQRRSRRLQTDVTSHLQGQSSGFWRKKRQAVGSSPETHYIEVSMIADYAVWKRFLDYANDDEEAAFNELQLYYKFLGTMIDVRYESVTSIDPTLAIRIRPVSLIVTDLPEEAIWTEQNRIRETFVGGIQALYDLRDWVKNGVGVPKADHTMLFTGYDLQGRNSITTTIGIAFIGTACTYNSVSIIEEFFTGTSGAVAAHELGHSLNADHDGVYRPCSDTTSHVMSTEAVFPNDPLRVSNPWFFSDCSVDAFGAFLDGATCTRNNPEPDTANLASASQEGEITFDADEQCRLAMGKDSFFCRSVQARRGFVSMCRHLYCYLPHDPGYCGSVIAAEFTVCGNGKWCNLGKCVSHPQAPIVQDTCPQGDEPGYDCTPDKCLQVKTRNVQCCLSCQSNATTTTKGPKSSENENLITGATPSPTLRPSSSMPPLSSSLPSKLQTSTPQPLSSSSSPSPPTTTAPSVETRPSLTTVKQSTTTESLLSSNFTTSTSSNLTTDTTPISSTNQANIRVSPSLSSASSSSPTPNTISPKATTTQLVTSTKSSNKFETNATSSSTTSPPQTSLRTLITSSITSQQQATKSTSGVFDPTTLADTLSSTTRSTTATAKTTTAKTTITTTTKTTSTEATTRTSETTTPSSSTPPRLVSTSTSIDAMVMATTSTKSTPAFVPCGSIQCLCKRCFHCYANLCPLFSPGGLYYSPAFGR